jgi:ABC-type transporter MlaC component
MKSIFDSSFEYTPSHETDLRKTFARIRREQQAHTQDEQQTQTPGAAAIPTLVQLKRAGARSVLGKTDAS